MSAYTNNNGKVLVLGDNVLSPEELEGIGAVADEAATDARRWEMGSALSRAGFVQNLFDWDE